MPTAIDQTNDALIVLFDYQENGILKEKLKSIIFGNHFVYYKMNRYDDRDGNTFCDDITSKFNREVMFPRSGRIIFCYDINMSNLSEEWIMRYRERMYSFYRNFAAAHAGVHYHITLLRSRANENINREKIIDAWNLFYSDINAFHAKHLEFLLYRNIAETFDMQEEGIAHFLQLMATKDYSRIFDLARYNGKVNLIGYKKFSSKNMQVLLRKQQELNDWLTKVNDSGLNQFWASVNQNLLEAIIAPYLKQVGVIREQRKMYPVPISAYRRESFFGSYVRKSYKSDEILNQNIRNYLEHYIQTLNPIRDEWYGSVDQSLTYTDFHSIKVEWWEQNGDARLQAGLQTYSLEGEEYNIFHDMIKSWIINYVKEKESNIEQEQQVKKEELGRIISEIQSSYVNLDACLKNIAADTSFQFPYVIGAPTLEQTLGIISTVVNASWLSKGYHIADLDEDDIYAIVDSSEVQCIKLSSCTGDLTLKMNDDDRKSELLRLIS